MPLDVKMRVLMWLWKLTTSRQNYVKVVNIFIFIFICLRNNHEESSSHAFEGATIRRRIGREYIYKLIPLM